MYNKIRTEGIRTFSTHRMIKNDVAVLNHFTISSWRIYNLMIRVYLTTVENQRISWIKSKYWFDLCMLNAIIMWDFIDSIFFAVVRSKNAIVHNLKMVKASVFMNWLMACRLSFLPMNWPMLLLLDLREWNFYEWNVCMRYLLNSCLSN